MEEKITNIVPYEQIEGRIYLLRGKKVMLDRDLARLYGVETKVLNQAVRRNLERFPSDFMFVLSEVETKILRSQIVTSRLDNYGGVRYLPTAFTEQGVAMLSGVLNSQRAIAVNIQIIRTFAKLREMIQENDYLRRKLEVLEKDYDEKFAIVFDAIRRLLDSGEEPVVEIGFKIEN
ncbi:MAG: KilA-N, DNA-binding domain protein [Candidatus Uhrbacteria bacterium GW2011_GWF2_44_350]|uniref:KilA-N, DNA-binding domain protein n=1 Tax=Candidatus Uhrbacteria bacterium GW2011_GWF2_44_350 TaxID=1619000 RepID=A0A0G1MCH1_9BACT|nr:MAG: KilA-N, DNA-binding domain protein [Candidatus Uhrbacteria bacterium GW2011_GWF2_44_350]HBR80946.1 DNA-binding protein [Candidatus Uhrbacteria bacterium]HCU31143.1 DNA-binding protein [Candidatus Uhrbacteria bacterium]